MLKLKHIVLSAAWYVQVCGRGKQWKMKNWEMHFLSSAFLRLVHTWKFTFLPFTLLCNFYSQFSFWPSPCYGRRGTVKLIAFCGMKRKHRLEIYLQKINKIASVLKTKTDKSQHCQRVLQSNEMCKHHQLKVECLK